MRLALPAAADLFRAPEQDPLAGQFSTRSGMDLLTEQVDPRPSERLRIELDLGVPYPEDSLRTAVAGYCEERIGRIDVQREAIQRRGRKELVVGLTFLAGCLAVLLLVIVMVRFPPLLIAVVLACWILCRLQAARSSK